MLVRKAITYKGIMEFGGTICGGSRLGCLSTFAFINMRVGIG